MTGAQYQKANICALLNEILYLGFPGAQDGDTIEDIIDGSLVVPVISSPTK